MRRPPIISTLEEVKAKTDLLDALSDIKVAFKKISESEEDVTSQPQVDVHHKSLGIELVPVDKLSAEYAMVDRFLTNTHGHTHRQYSLVLEDVFKLDKSSRFDDSVGNKMLLWHGSRVTNFVGILSQGLRIAPPEAPVSGYMFGKGVGHSCTARASISADKLGGYGADDRFTLPTW